MFLGSDTSVQIDTALNSASCITRYNKLFNVHAGLGFELWVVGIKNIPADHIKITLPYNCEEIFRNYLLPQSEEQQFLTDLEKKLWNAADKLRSTLDAAQYKHTVLGLVFLKYVSDSLKIRQDELTTQFKNPEHDYYLDPEDFDGADGNEYAAEIAEELEQRDYYAEANVFWMPAQARY